MDTLKSFRHPVDHQMLAINYELQNFHTDMFECVMFCVDCNEPIFI